MSHDGFYLRVSSQTGRTAASRTVTAAIPPLPPIFFPFAAKQATAEVTAAAVTEDVTTQSGTTPDATQTNEKHAVKGEQLAEAPDEEAADAADEVTVKAQKKSEAGDRADMAPQQRRRRQRTQDDQQQRPVLHDSDAAEHDVIARPAEGQPRNGEQPAPQRKCGYPR
jgi:hypothetical protein